MGKPKGSSGNSADRKHQDMNNSNEEPISSSKKSKGLIFVLPGDDIRPHMVSLSHTNGTTNNETEKIVLGTGLRQTNGTEEHQAAVYATLSGCLQYACRTSGGKNVKTRHVYWIRSSNAARAVQVEDRVVGVVQERVGSDGAGGEYHRIALGNQVDHTTAVLSNLSFEGATKRNKPNLHVGQVLYARVAQVLSGGLEPVLSCQLGPHDSAAIKAKDWMTNEGVYGLLQGGTVLQVSPGLAQVLLSKDAAGLWESVTRHDLTSQFEVAIGVNGMVWLHASPSPQAIVVLQNAILNSQLLTPEQTAGMVQQLVFTMKKQMQQEEEKQNG